MILNGVIANSKKINSVVEDIQYMLMLIVNLSANEISPVTVERAYGAPSNSMAIINVGMYRVVGQFSKLITVTSSNLSPFSKFFTAGKYV